MTYNRQWFFNKFSNLAGKVSNGNTITIDDLTGDQINIIKGNPIEFIRGFLYMDISLFNMVLGYYSKGNINDYTYYEQGETIPLMVGAIKNQRMDLINFLLEKGININVVYNEFTPLLYAIETRNIDIVKKLLNSGAGINALDDTIYPLTYAVGEGIFDIAYF